MNNNRYKNSITSEVKISILTETNTNNKPKTFFQTLSNYFGEFSRNTSIHGFKYLGRKEGCTIEKIWWLTVLTICIYICGILTIITLKKREENPVFISFRQDVTRIWDIPFPAVTICPAHKIKISNFNFTYYKHKFMENNLTKDELKYFMDANMVCKTGHHHLKVSTSEHKITQATIDFLIKNSMSLDDVLDFCIRHKPHTSCKNEFSPIFTSTGICFSFNMLDKSELYTNITYQPNNYVSHPKIQNWSVDHNYFKTLDATYPFRITSITDGLYFGLKISNSDIDASCEKYKGFKMILHHPAYAPTISNRYLVLSPNESYKVWIKPEIITTSSNLDDYYPHKRGCYYSNEHKLKFYKIYTEENCKLECISNMTIEKCGCVPYYIPREKSTRMCGLTDVKCVISVKEEFLSIEMKLGILENSGQLFSGCDCLPSCTSILYSMEYIPEQLTKMPQNGSSLTTVYISFKDPSFLTMERNELFSNADFWASCGGLLGLFTGFSVVSLAEIIYFLTLKWICKLWKTRNHH